MNGILNKIDYLNQREKQIEDRFDRGLIKWSRSIKRILIKRNGYKCFKCKLSQWLGKPIPLEVHHIDGDSENNMPENLELICLNCHGLTDNFRGKNFGKGRHSRRVRYTENKSY